MNISFNPKLTRAKELFILMAIFIGSLSFRLYILAPILYGFPCACGGVKYLATVPILVCQVTH